jgi:hypothetical protein
LRTHVVKRYVSPTPYKVVLAFPKAVFHTVGT